MRVSRLTRLVSILLILFLGTTAFVVLTMPFLIDWYSLLLTGTAFVSSQYRLFVMIFLMVNGSGGLWILYELLAMVRSIESDPFVLRNVASLRRIGVLAVGIAALFFIKCFIYITPLTLICGLVMMLCGLFSLVLMDVFRRAVQYKQENDLTI